LKDLNVFILMNDSVGIPAGKRGEGQPMGQGGYPLIMPLTCERS
jgi:hypothetical protein